MRWLKFKSKCIIHEFINIHVRRADGKQNGLWARTSIFFDKLIHYWLLSSGKEFIKSICRCGRTAARSARVGVRWSFIIPFSVDRVCDSRLHLLSREHFHFGFELEPFASRSSRPSHPAKSHAISRLSSVVLLVNGSLVVFGLMWFSRCSSNVFDLFMVENIDNSTTPISAWHSFSRKAPPQRRHFSWFQPFNRNFVYQLGAELHMFRFRAPDTLDQKRARCENWTIRSTYARTNGHISCADSNDGNHVKCRI